MTGRRTVTSRSLRTMGRLHLLSHFIATSKRPNNPRQALFCWCLCVLSCICESHGVYCLNGARVAETVEPVLGVFAVEAAASPEAVGRLSVDGAELLQRGQEATDSEP